MPSPPTPTPRTRTSQALHIQSLPPTTPRSVFCQHRPSPELSPNHPLGIHDRETATMSPYNSSPHGYQALHSPAANDLQHQPPTHHGLPPPSPSYPYDGQSAPQLQSPTPYANSQNGHGDGQMRLPMPVHTPPSASASGGEGAKANRLRKACDSCSIRKVKVCTSLF